MSAVFNLEHCEYKKSPVGPKLDLWLSIVFIFHFCTPILSQPSTPTPITTTCNITVLLTYEANTKQLEQKQTLDQVTTIILGALRVN